MRSRFVRPETITLPISDGDTLIVKRRLTAGEQREAFTRMYTAGIDGGLRVNPLQTGLALITAYLVDWTLTDEGGVVVPIKGLSREEFEATINTLDPASFTEIKQAIEAHEAAMEEERATEKKTRGGVNGADVISPSPSAPDGGLNGSVN